MEIFVTQFQVLCHVTAVSEVDHENYRAAIHIAARYALYSFYNALLISAVQRNSDCLTALNFKRVKELEGRILGLLEGVHNIPVFTFIGRLMHSTV